MKIRKSWLIISGLFLCVLLANPAWALLIQEEFLGSSPQDFFSLAEPDALPLPGVGNRANFWFDLANLQADSARNEARLIDTSGARNVRIDTIAPSIDADQYDPTSMVLTSATIAFWISDYADPDKERFVIDIEGGPNEYNSTRFELQDFGNELMITLDLVAEGFLDIIQGGSLFAFGIAPNIGGNNVNTFNIDRVLFTANAAPVPEPTTMVLLGTGLAGMAIARRRRKLKNRS